MTAKNILQSVCVLMALLAAILCLSACGTLDVEDLLATEETETEEATVTYMWYDADGTVLYEEAVPVGASATEYPLPADNDKWDYIEWKNNFVPTEKIAYRVPQNSYFVGNVFQIIVQNLGEQPISTGSAFVFNSDGWFVTNAHVMKDAYYAQAIFNIPNDAAGESFTYLSINSGSYYHLDKDIYIGKIENYDSIKSHYKDIPIDLSYEIGEETYSVGYPLSSTELIVNKGEVTESWSDLYEKLYSGNSYICSSSYIAPGSSGGILTNENLEVIGITTLGWTDEDDVFVSGASISAFNFNNLLQNTNDNELISLIDRFHKEEKVYVGYFNEAKADEAEGLTEKYYFDDGSLAYIYEQNEENENEDGVAYSSAERLLLGVDGFMSYKEEIYWENGQRRMQSFYGFYDHQKGFETFIYEFKYEWSNGRYYAVECSDINYSPTVSLTLNRCEVDASYGFDISESHITYAKEEFNSIYEWLTEDMARFE